MSQLKFKIPKLSDQPLENKNTFAKPTLPTFSFKAPKPKSQLPKSNNLFTEENSDEEPSSDPTNNDKSSIHKLDRDYMNSQLRKTHKKVETDRNSQIAIQKALEQDQSIMEYDKIFDNISSEVCREKIDNLRKLDHQKNRQPKYIKGLMKTAAKRNLESERRYERKALRDRKDEDDKFGDKEKYMTPAYAKKLELLEFAEQEEKRRDAIDELQNVEKQKDISGFYRHYLKDNFKTQMERLQDMEDKFKTTSGDSDTKPPEIKQRHDSSSSESDSDQDCDADSNKNSNYSGSDEEKNDKPRDKQKEECEKQLHKKFDIPVLDGFAAPSTTFTKSSARSRVTAGGAGIETEIDYKYQLSKLNVIFKKTLTSEDIDSAKRKFHQRCAIRNAKGGWIKILSEK